jgi:hypothetical protein
MTLKTARSAPVAAAVKRGQATAKNATARTRLAPGNLQFSFTLVDLTINNSFRFQLLFRASTDNKRWTADRLLRRPLAPKQPPVQGPTCEQHFFQCRVDRSLS